MEKKAVAVKTLQIGARKRAGTITLHLKEGCVTLDKSKRRGNLGDDGEGT
jgi:hypothetical protein